MRGGGDRPAARSPYLQGGDPHPRAARPAPTTVPTADLDRLPLPTAPKACLKTVPSSQAFELLV